MMKFFQNIKNNLERTLSNKNDKSNNDGSKLTNNNEIKEASSSDSDNNDDDKSINNDLSLFSPKKNNNTGIIDGKGNAFAQNFIKQQTMFGNKFFKFGAGKSNKNGKNGLYESSVFDEFKKDKKNGSKKNVDLNGDIEEIDEEIDNELDSNLRRNSQDFSRNMCSYSKMKKSFFHTVHTLSKLNIEPKISSTKKVKDNLIKDSNGGETNSYDKSDYEKTLRCGTINDSENMIDSSPKEKKIAKSVNGDVNDKMSLSKSEEKDKKNNIYIKINKYNTPINMNINVNNKINYVNNQNFIPKIKLKKYKQKLLNLQKQSNGFNQLLFCARVAIENALDVCQTISSCYKWIGENYLESQIKKVIKEAKLKEKQKEDKEKYGNIGNVPKKVTPAKKKIIRASDQSFKLLLNMIMGIQIAVQSIPNFHIKNNEDLSKYMTNMLYSIQTINFGKKKKKFLY